MHQYVEYIVYFIIALQLFFFIKNLLRMHKFSSIFKEDDSWSLHSDYTTGLVDGIKGDGNSIFDSIVKSINKYLGNNAGSVIDFNLLKDSIDRHCDSAEEDISTQTPIPLYLGLAGTMAGVILGLGDLLETDAIMSLIGSSSEELSKSSEVAAEGIDALLSGVAWAMVASICGILLTTLNSLLFKSCKLKHEEGKNSFLAWMQSELLPMLPSDTSQALTNLVKNLNEFNNTFSQNTSNLGNALEAVNQSYAIQAEIIKAVHDMDVMKMAKANVRVLQELQQCTDRLEQFNEYLYAIQGYTSAIHEFETLFNREAQRTYILEEIRDFFARHKGELAHTMSEADDTLKTALKSIAESTSESVGEFHTQFVEQSEQFKAIIQQERDAFQQYAKELAAQFGSQLDKMPKLAKQLEEIADIPVRLDKLIEKIEKSNTRLADQVAAAVKQSQSSRQQVAHTVDGGTAVVAPAAGLPDWMKYTGITALVIIALACVFNVVVMFYPIDLKAKQQPAQQPAPTVVVPPAPVSQPSDTTAFDSAAAKPTTKPATQSVGNNSARPATKPTTKPAAQPVNPTPSK
ncbi:MAG: hypothetical protein ACI4AM_07235 [Muribaculaceae bacterium]